MRIVRDLFFSLSATYSCSFIDTITLNFFSTKVLLLLIKVAHKKKCIMKLLILSSALLSPYHRATAFSSHVLNRPFIQTTPSSDAPADMPSATKLSAIIYGWDDDDSDEADEGVPFYSASESEFGVQQCPPEGIAVAESLMRDPNRMGSFARLAAGKSNFVLVKKY